MRLKFNTFEELLSTFKNNEISQRRLLAYAPKFIQDINNITSFLDNYDNIDITERVYYIINDLHDIVRCKYCTNKAIWTGRLNEGYKDICSNPICRTKQLSESHNGLTKISENRKENFIKRHNEIKIVNDEVIKDLYTYDIYVDYTTNPIIIDYLNKRYKDSSSLLETVQRIRFNVEEKPKCPMCGNPVTWIGKRSRMFSTYCSSACAANDQQTKDKKKEAQLKNWGSECCYDSSKYKQHLKETIGVEYHTQRPEIIQKRKDTLIEKYGTTNISAVEGVEEKKRKTMMERYGYEYIFQIPEQRQHMYDMCKANNKLGTSKAEERVYGYFKELGYDNVRRFEYSERFPYNVDFYLEDYDLYIEYHGSQYHHESAFLGTKEDLEEIENLREKNRLCIQTNGKETSQYESMIHTWSQLDVKKRNDAKARNIRYLEIYQCDRCDDLKIQLDIYLTLLNNKYIFNYTDEYLNYEFQFYKSMKCTELVKSSNRNGIVKYFQGRNFYKKEIDIYINDPVTRRELIQNRVKYQKNKKIKESELTLEDLITGFKKSGIYYGYSHFPSEWTNWFVNHYVIHSVYDPCGGWGHHMLGMLGCERIIYNDLSKSTVQGVREICERFNTSQVEIHNDDARTYIPDNVDAFFMCPPYYNLERYECGDFKDIKGYKDFLNSIMDIWQKNDARIFGIVLREDYIDLIDLKPNEIFDLPTKLGQFSKGVRHYNERFYIFKK